MERSFFSILVKSKMNFENMFNISFSEREEEYLGKDREIKLEIVLQ